MSLSVSVLLDGGCKYVDGAYNTVELHQKQAYHMLHSKWAEANESKIEIYWLILVIVQQTLNMDFTDLNI